MLMGGKAVHGSYRKKPLCVVKDCKKIPQWLFFVDDIGFMESCEKHKSQAVMELVNQILKFNLKQKTNLSN